ncbi:MAG: hypothetical protein PHN82_12390, partial [bacterium]|nr:hypothetical protein [bacterium]
MEGPRGGRSGSGRGARAGARLAAACAAACALGASAAPWRPAGVAVTATADPTTVTVGDPISYTLTVSAPAGVEVTPPRIGESLGEFRAREIGRSGDPGDDGPREVTFRYDLRVFATGEKEIPAVTVTLRDRDGRTAEVAAAPVAVLVESVLDAEARDIRDIKPPVDLPAFPL